MATLAGGFGLLALTLACVGLYGLLAYSVAQRTKEIGIRMALGADGMSVIGLVLRQSMTLVGIGIAVGLPLALLAGRAVASQLYGVAPSDPLTLPWTGNRRGAYLEAVYRLSRTWDIGYRFDKLWAPSSALPFATGYDPERHSIEATWRNSEFSFFRLQYSHDDPIENIVDNAIYLQYDVAIGAHGAHKF